MVPSLLASSFTDKYAVRKVERTPRFELALNWRSGTSAMEFRPTGRNGRVRDFGNPSRNHQRDLCGHRQAPAKAAVMEAEMIGRKYGVQGTPAWLVAQRLMVGLQPASEFERLAEYAVQLPR